MYKISQVFFIGCMSAFFVSEAGAKDSWSGNQISVGVGATRSVFTNTHEVSGDWLRFTPYRVSTLNDSGSSRFVDFGPAATLALGHTRQVSDFVYGVEIDYNRLKMEDSRIDDNGSTGKRFFPNGRYEWADWVNKYSSNWYASARARFGYDMGRFMPYVTGGVAYTRLNVSQFIYFESETRSIAERSDKRSALGWVAGAGVEYALNDNWRLRGEYRHVSFKNSNPLNFASNTFPTFQHKLHSELEFGHASVNLSYNF